MSIDKVAYVFDPFALTGVEVPANLRNEAKEVIAEFLREQVLEYVGGATSPIQGGKWKRTLSEGYKGVKDDFSSDLRANMELTGDMLDALEVVDSGGNKLSLQIEGDQAPKADGHNNHSGQSRLPPREFIPKPGQSLKPDIIKGMQELLESLVEENKPDEDEEEDPWRGFFRR